MVGILFGRIFELETFALAPLVCFHFADQVYSAVQAVLLFAKKKSSQA